MRAVLGVFILLVGFTVGYLVLSGKLPASTAKGGGLDTSHEALSTPAVVPSSQGMSAIGLPTMAHLDDLVSSNGGMR
jgi:hypothetical protein